MVIKLRVFGILVAVGFAMQVPNAGSALADSPNRAINPSDIWESNGIVRRRTLMSLAAMGPSSWNLPKLLAPLREYEYSPEAELINILTALDPQSVERPIRMTEVMLNEVNTSSLERRRIGVFALGLLLESAFGSESYTLSRSKLLHLLEDKDAALRQEVAVSLGNLQSTGFKLGRSRSDVNGLQEIGRALVKSSQDKDAGVREASLRTISRLAFLGEHNGVTFPLVEKKGLIAIGRKSLMDPSSSVRSAGLELLNNIDIGYPFSLTRERISIAEKSMIYIETLSRIADLDPSVMKTALEALDKDDFRGPLKRSRSKDIADLVLSGRITPERVPTLLRMVSSTSQNLNLGESEEWSSLLSQLTKGKSLSASIIARTLQVRTQLAAHSSPESNQEVSSAISLYRYGLTSTDPVVQMDAMTGLSDLYQQSSRSGGLSLDQKRDLLQSLEPAFSSPHQPVRWAAAITSGHVNPDDNRSLLIIGDILGAVEDNGIRDRALRILASSSKTEAAVIFRTKTERENRRFFYLRSCMMNDWYSQDQEVEIVKGLAEPSCRQIVANSLNSIKKQAIATNTVSTLVKFLQSGDTDRRFAAAYSLGTLLDPREEWKGPTPVTPELRKKIVLALSHLVSAQAEDLELRRIAATVLFRNNDIDAFVLKRVGLQEPQMKCPNPIGKFGKMAGGFSFDVYEGRCMYDNGFGCGDGLPEIYSKLLRILNGKISSPALRSRDNGGLK